jgi:hypothetical protein
MTQKTLFDVEQGPIAHHGYPMSRATDPPTSLAAAYKHEVTGRADSNRRIILDQLQRQDGQTGHELGVSTGLGQVECCRRLPELEKAGLVKACDSDRPCTVKRESKQRRWWYLGE